MAGVEVLFLSRQDIDALELGLQDVLDAVEVGLAAHGNKKVIMPSKDHLVLDFPEKLFNILKGYVEPVNAAGVKVIGDFQKNYEHDMPSEFATVVLFRPETGAPYAIINGTSTTWMRTGAVTAIGAKYLACEKPRVLGHIGARGTAWYNVAMLDLLFDFEEIRVTSKRPASRERFAAEMSERLGKTVRVMDTSEQTVRDADIIIDASRLLEHQVLVDKTWVKPGALVQPYGAVLSTSPDLPIVADKLIVDDWNQCKQSQYGQFAGLIQDGELRDEHCYGEIGEVVAGLKPGRTSDQERIVFWHKGFAVSDIVIGHLAYEKAREKGIGTLLEYDSAPRDM
jgi:ornithine cyclodeaminase